MHCLRQETYNKRSLMFHIVRLCFLQDHSTHIRGTVTLEANLSSVVQILSWYFSRITLSKILPKIELKAIPR